MAHLKELLNSNNILQQILSFDDETLFSCFKELSNLDFYLNRYGMSSKHEFTVIDHTKKVLKNFSLALKYKENQSLFESELVGGTTYKKDFFKRVIQLIDKLNLKTDSDDFKVIVLALLLHDVGKGSYDKTDLEIEDEAQEKGLTPEYLKLLYRNKNHEERGAFLVFSLLEECEGVSQSFAERVKHLIIGHDSFSKLQSKQDFDFLTFLRRIMDYTSAYNYPIIRQPNPEELLIRELNINYLIFLFDIYSVDDQGKVWYSVKQEKETVYLRAKWLLGQKLEDLLVVIDEQFNYWDIEKKDQLFNILKKNFLQSFRTNTSFLLGNELEGFCPPREKRELLTLIHDFINHTDTMYPLYLNQTTPQEKLFYIKLFKKAYNDFVFHMTHKKDILKITLVKKYAPERTLLKVVETILSGSIDCGRTMKIVHLHAYSGEDDCLIDIITVKYIGENDITEQILEKMKVNLEKCNDPNYKVGHLELPVSQEEFDYRVESLNVELGEVEIASRKFQELNIILPIVSNIVLYSCLDALSFINIIDVKLEPVDSHYVYAFLLSNKQNYQLTSAASFKKELIDQLNKHMKVTA